MLKNEQKILKLRLTAMAFSLLLLSIVALNLVVNVTTPFSGTTYMPLPSNYLSNHPLNVFSIQTDSTGKEYRSHEIIPSGSFIISINGHDIDSSFNESDTATAMKNFMSYIDRERSEQQIVVLIPTNIEYKNDWSKKSIFRKYANIYYIDKQQLENDAVILQTKGILIGYIEGNGATDRAGVRQGDILLSVNEKEWKMLYNKDDNSYRLSTESLSQLRTQPRNEPLNYKILRNNHEKEFEVYLATFGIKIDYLILILLGMFYFGAGLYFLMKNPLSVGARINGLWLVLLGFYIAASRHLNPPDFDSFAFIKILLVSITPILVYPVIMHGLLYFPDENSKVAQKKWAIIVLYSFYFVTALIYSVWYIVDYKTISDIWLDVLFYSGILYYIILRVIYSKYNVREFKKIRILIYSVCALTIFISNRYLLVKILGIPLNTTVIFILNYSFLLNIILPVMYLLITWKYKIYDISFKMKRTTQYNFLKLFWNASIIFISISALWIFSNIHFRLPNIRLTGTTIEFLSSPLNFDANLAYGKMLFAILALVVVLVVYNFAKIGQNYIDKKFYRQKYDFKLAQRELIGLLETKISFNELSVVIVKKLSDILRLKRVGIIFFKKSAPFVDNNVFCYDSVIGDSFCRCIIKDVPGLVNLIKKPTGTSSLPNEFNKYFLENNFQYIIPIQSRGTMLGVLFIGEKLSETTLTSDDIEFLTSIASSASVAIENAMLYEELTEQERIKHELELARNIQIASLPQQVPQIKGLDICGTSLPAFEVGGDFYDFFNGNKKSLTVVLGDVSGKGTSAALYMSKVQGIFRTLNEFELSPKDLFVRANRLLYKNIESKAYITAIGARFNFLDKTLTLARAGHLPLLKFNSKTDNVDIILSKGIGLGLTDGLIFDRMIDEIQVNFENNDICLFVSDGITESRNRLNEDYGYDRLINLLKKHSNKNSKQICDGIMSSVADFAENTNQFDDMTIVVVKCGEGEVTVEV